MVDRQAYTNNGDIIIDGDRYVIDKKEGWLEGDPVSLADGEPEIPVSAEWPVGVPGGLGETKRQGRDSDGHAFASLNTFPYGHYELPPHRYSTGVTGLADVPTWFVEQGTSPLVAQTGTFTASAGTGNQTVTHNLDSVPVAIMLWTSGALEGETLTPGISMSIGFTDTTTSRCISFSSGDNINPSQAAKGFNTNLFTRLSETATAAVIDAASYVSATTSTFTISWTTRTGGTGLLVHYKVLGGTGVQAKVSDWSAGVPSVPVMNVTDVGFRPEVVIHLGSGQTAIGNSDGGSYSVGAMDKDGNQWAVSGVCQDGVATSNSAKAQRADVCAIHGNPATGTYTALNIGAFNGMLGNGFSTRWITIGAGNERMASLSVRGVLASVGTFTKPTSAAPVEQPPIDLGYASQSYILASFDEAANPNPVSGLKFTLGAASTLGHMAVAVFSDNDNVTPTNNSKIDVQTLAFLDDPTFTFATASGAIASHATGAGATTAGTTATDINDTTRNLNVNEVAGETIVFQTGPAAGQSRQITTNTQTAFQVSIAFSPAPTAGGGDSYIVSGVSVVANMVNSAWINWISNTTIAIQIGYVAFAPRPENEVAPGNIYCFNGSHSYKLTQASPPVLLEDKDFSLDTQFNPGLNAIAVGHPAKFNASWYLPLGSQAPFAKLSYSAPTIGDLWFAAQDGTTALAFATVQDGPSSKLTRAHTGHFVDISIDGADWAGDDFEVGDASTIITSMVDSGTQTVVTKNDGTAFVLDPTGTPIKLNSSDNAFRNLNNGCGLTAIEGTNAAIWNTSLALMLYRGTNALPQAIGPDSIRTNQVIPTFTDVPVDGTHYEFESVEDTPFSYGLYRSGALTYIHCYERTGNSHRIHSFYTYTGVLRGLKVDSAKRLWTCFVTSATIGYLQLGKDGSPDAGAGNLGYGEVSTAYQVVYPEWDMGYPHTLKQWQRMEVKSRYGGGTTPIQLQAALDGLAINNVGLSTVLGNVVRRYWTQGASDTGYDIRPVVSINTTAGLNVAPVPPGQNLQILSLRVHAFLRPDFARKIKIVINTTDQYGNEAWQSDAGMDPKTIRDTLRALERGAPIACIDPDGNAVQAFVTKVQDQEARVGTEAAEYVVTLDAVVWVSS